MAWKCRSCGTQFTYLKPTLFCPHCGVGVQKEPETGKGAQEWCYWCNHPLLPDADFCHQCGHQMGTAFDPGIKVEPGSFVDERDGRTYRTVRIGDQVWMAENLDYGKMVPGKRDGLCVGEKWCFNDDESLGYGGLYTWKVAMESCPKGWHVPTQKEWGSLVRTLGGEIRAAWLLKSRTGWYKGFDGVDAVGFSALPSGWRDKFGRFDNLRDQGEARFWFSDPDRVCKAAMLHITMTKEIYSRVVDGKYGYAVRCVKD